MTIRIPPEALLWAGAGLGGAAVAMIMAGTGLAVLPLFLPLVVLVAVLVEVRAPYAWATGLGVLGAVDFFALMLFLDPPCVAPILTNLGNGEFQLSCGEHQDMLPLTVAVVAGTLVAGALIVAVATGRLASARRGRSPDERELDAAANYDPGDDSDPDK